MLIVVQRPSPLWVLAFRRHSGPDCIRMRKVSKPAGHVGPFIPLCLACGQASAVMDCHRDLQAKGTLSALGCLVSGCCISVRNELKQCGRSWGGGELSKTSCLDSLSWGHQALLIPRRLPFSAASAKGSFLPSPVSKPEGLAASLTPHCHVSSPFPCVRRRADARRHLESSLGQLLIPLGSGWAIRSTVRWRLMVCVSSRLKSLWVIS